MTWNDALAPRSLFFRNAQALIPWPPSASTVDAIELIAVILLIWLLISILFAVLVWPFVARYFFAEPTTLEEEAEALRRWEVKRWFKANQKMNKKLRGQKPKR